VGDITCKASHFCRVRQAESDDVSKLIQMTIDRTDVHQIKSTAYDFDFLRVLISCHIDRPLWA
ncbi:hypothetical protein, partial [Streptococcus suis]|uniref:hypothetical protein n=1 Tax=Streptococcus suis TaxID=1307 RepID=UPI001ABEC029